MDSHFYIRYSKKGEMDKLNIYLRETLIKK